MKRLLVVLILTASFIFPSLLGAQDAEQTERINASFLLALGRKPTPDEMRDWGNLGKMPLPALVARHQESLKRDAPVGHDVAVRAWVDAFGRNPTEAELSSTTAATYADLLKQHVAWLAAHPADHRQVIERAYRFVVARAAYDVEFDYWKERATLPYVLLVGAIDNWARRNAPGLMATTGTPSVAVNCRFLVTLVLSPAVANEARAIVGLPVWSDVARLKNPGCNVVSVGAEEIASVGGMHFAVVGADGAAGP